MGKETKWERFTVCVPKDKNIAAGGKSNSDVDLYMGHDRFYWVADMRHAIQFVTRYEAEGVIGGLPEAFRQFVTVVEVPRDKWRN